MTRIKVENSNQKFSIFCSTDEDGFDSTYLKLKIGEQKYLGQTIEVSPIKTTSALCYKVESTSKFNRATSFIIAVVDLNRKKSKELN